MKLTTKTMTIEDIAAYREFVRKLMQGEADISLPPHAREGLGRDLLELASELECRQREQQELDKLVNHLNAGLALDDVLVKVYEGFRKIIPYNRIGFSLIEEDGQTVRAYWAKTDQPEVFIEPGYTASLKGSSLEKVLETGQPRIINDLYGYLEKHPGSESTGKIIKEGIKSSLTCPLVLDGAPVGFIFFSSIYSHAYENVHVHVFERIAENLALVLQKGRLISELSAQKQAIEAQNAELLRLNDLKNTFLGVAAHDLRSPISTIKLATDLLVGMPEGTPDAEREEYMETFTHTVQRQVQHMLVLLNDLLDIAQMEAGRMTLKVSPTSMKSLLADAVWENNQLSAAKGTQVVLGETPEGQVVVDPQRIRQVLDNIISNAVKYSPPGSTIWTWAEHHPHAWRVCVRDQGPGVTEEDQKRMFQHFTRLSAQPTGGEKSVGLGLAITRRLVDAHGGEIGVESKPGQGATFWFTLPASE